MSDQDPSNGYEEVADAFIAARSSSGSEIVRAWAEGLPEGGRVLDIGAGFGLPNTPILIEAGLNIVALDASASLAAAFEKRFPGIPIYCEPVEDSAILDQDFDGILAVGLIFLLEASVQKKLIRRISQALNSGGSFLFSAPTEVGSWEDLLTQKTSRSLGHEVYRTELVKAGFIDIGTRTDEGDSNYYLARKP